MNTKNLVWNGWQYLTKSFEVMILNMTAFKVKGTYYELNHVLDKIIEEKILHTD